jgi:hypothetical protein
MKKNPGTHVATVSALDEDQDIEFNEWTADINVLQNFMIVPDNYVIADPPNFFQIQSEIAGDFTYCLAPTSDANLSKVKPKSCDSTDTAQLWFYENGFFKSGISSSGFPPCMIKEGSNNLSIDSCDPVAGDRFIYDFFDYTLSFQSGNKLVTIKNDSVDSSKAAKIFSRNLEGYPNGGQQWRIIDQTR